MLADVAVDRPLRLDDALALLASPVGGERPDVLAGGTDLMVLYNARTRVPGRVLDIHGLDELRGIFVQRDGRLVIGALSTYEELIGSELVRRLAPALVEASRTVGAAQIQARGTLGGNVANASPAGDTLPVLLAQGCEVELVSGRGLRRVDFGAFYKGYRQPDIAPDELIKRFVLRPVPAGSRSSFRKVGTRLAQAISKVMIAGVGRVEDGRVVELRLAAGSVAPVPLRLEEAERAAIGLPTAEAAEAAGAAAAAQVAPIDDVRSSATYRRAVTGRLVRRFVLELGG